MDIKVNEFIHDLNFILQDYFNALTSGSTNRSFLVAIAKIMDNAVARQFQTEGRYLGGRGGKSFGYKWFDLAPSTIAERIRKKFYPIRILRRRAGDAGLSGSIHSNIGADYVETGTNIFYAPYLHFGTDKMPPRPIFPSELPPEVIEDIEESFVRIFNRVVR